MFSLICMDYLNYPHKQIYKLDRNRTKYGLRKYFFANRVIIVWIGSQYTVVTHETINQFKNRVENFLSKQEI